MIDGNDLLAERSCRYCRAPAPLSQATIRSSKLGGNLFATAAAAVDPTSPPDGAAEDNPAAAATADTAAAYITERENLVRTLGSILRSKPSSTPAAAGNDTCDVGAPPAPSSNVPKTVVTTDVKDNLVATPEKLKLAEALVSFLPPAREDGLEGVTIISVALRPEWCAPPAVTANTCVCLLHLLDGEHSGRIAEQVGYVVFTQYRSDLGEFLCYPWSRERRFFPLFDNDIRTAARLGSNGWVNKQNVHVLNGTVSVDVASFFERWSLREGYPASSLSSPTREGKGVLCRHVPTPPSAWQSWHASLATNR